MWELYRMHGNVHTLSAVVGTQMYTTSTHRTIHLKWVDFYCISLLHPWRRKWQPTPVFSPENSMDRGAWWATKRWGHKESDTTKQLIQFYISKNGKTWQPHSLPLLLLPPQNFHSLVDYLSSHQRAWGFHLVFSMVAQWSACQCRRCRCDPWIGK